MSADKRRLKKFITGILLCILILIIHPLWLPLPASFLLVKDDIKKADAIIVLSGDWELAREDKAIELYKSGFAGRILRIFEKENRGFEVMRKLLNSDATQEAAYRRYFESSGVPKAAVVTAETAYATSTFDELRAAKEVASRNNFKSVILVTSDYHMRRALMTARWLFREVGISIYPATTYSKNFNPDRWWMHEEDIKGIIMEYLSIGFYVCYHFTTGK